MIYYQFYISLDLNTFKIEEKYTSKNFTYDLNTFMEFYTPNNIEVYYNTLEQIEITDKIKNAMYKKLLKLIEREQLIYEKQYKEIDKYQKENKEILNAIRTKKLKNIND